MDAEKKLKYLEDECKLVKGELKATMTNIRDFLLNLQVPKVDTSFHDSDESSKPPILGTVPLPQPELPKSSEAMSHKSAEEESHMSMSQKGSVAAPPFPVDWLEASMPPAEEVPPVVSRERKEEKPPAMAQVPVTAFEKKEEKKKPKAPEMQKQPEALPEEKKTEGSAGSPSSAVNPLVNLIRWVAKAKGEIGEEHLGEFLDVYAIGGGLSPDLKEVILHLAEVIEGRVEAVPAQSSGLRLFTEQLSTFIEICRVGGQVSPEIASAILKLIETLKQSETGAPKAVKSDIWSQLILELHSVLKGNEALLLAQRLPSRKKDEPAEAAEPGGKSVKLKLVLPANGGSGKEFGITLQPEFEGESFD